MTIGYWVPDGKVLMLIVSGHHGEGVLLEKR
jgi:hypothetical protein